eukprot:TRINITY_DN20650_c0_g1_i1.p1 TRINITY_DN20650_c0_g1~~TRINITY_DN20650_c0_g1_i1.p1  ORF type:complete len:1115 (+),score=250.60 TRINITY_DN20650_c0_g1_i1:356-3700(+)
MSSPQSMADFARNTPVERDIGQAITALKKGACLLKYGRRGKPKFCPFRLSNDESVLVWYSGKEEKHLRLSHVTRIIPGQRTAIFQRQPRPEKEYQSFSLIYNDRSLDLICKDKDEAEVWFVGLKALISRGNNRRWKSDSRSDGAASSETNSPRTFTRINSPIVGASRNRTPYGSPPRNGFEKVTPENLMYPAPIRAFYSETGGGYFNSTSSESRHGSVNGISRDAFRYSLSSALSSSSQGSGQDDADAMGDVFIWGEGTGDGVLGGGSRKVGSEIGARMDSLLPKALESAVVLDVQNIACGSRHAALVTKQGEVFCWGEESGGRLGHGVDVDVPHPKLVESLSNTNIELVACGEYHTCAVTLSGDLYSWGNGGQNFGILGHGNEVSHWVPKKVNGPLDGIHIASISCGPWHTAAVSSAGQLFTFGDGAFGVLGHGDRKSVACPREVLSLKGLRTVRAACGVWHTAAVVEVMVGSSSSSNCSSGKLFTWGDGDKGRLGHGDKESRLVPTCVAALVDHNFCQVAAGHSLTVALTTSGHVYTMGSSVYGQLGCPQADGKLPVRVEGKLFNTFVEDIACGAYHVAVLTSKTEVYTWGKGSNGQLGHGNIEDMNTPTLVEALKDKQVKSIVCGSNFTGAICLHKWVSGADHSMCSGCRLPFGFTRKRHNCYNCGFVFCHACSSKKSLKASLAPNPNRPYRVCDNCLNKLKRMSETGLASRSSNSRKGTVNLQSVDISEKQEKVDVKTPPQLSRSSTMDEQIKSSESKSYLKKNKKSEFHSSRVSPVPNGAQWGSINLHPVKKFFSASVPGSRMVSRASSPVSRRSSPPRSTTPTPTLSGLKSAGILVEDVNHKNDTLAQEVTKLRVQVDSLTRRCQIQEVELERTLKQLKDAITIAGEESAKCKAAKEVIKSLTAQLKDMAERLPGGGGTYLVNRSAMHSTQTVNGINLHSGSYAEAMELKGTEIHGQQEMSNLALPPTDANGNASPLLADGPFIASSRSSVHSNQGKSFESNRLYHSHIQDGLRSGARSPAENDHVRDGEWVEQDEPGVYITLSQLPGGEKDLKRVRFSRKKFSEKEAEKWWTENRARVYEQYNVRMVQRTNMGPSSTSGRIENIAKG